MSRYCSKHFTDIHSFHLYEYILSSHFWVKKQKEAISIAQGHSAMWLRQGLNLGGPVPKIKQEKEGDGDV